MRRHRKPTFSTTGTPIDADQLQLVAAGEAAFKPSPQIPPYVPLSQSHPKVERDLLRVSYR